MARRLVPVLFAALACATSAGASTGVPAEPTLTMDDGVALACGFGRAPAGTGQAVVLFHGLGGRHQDLAPIAAAFNAAGYTTLACDARGQGASGGTFDLDGPRTVTDARAELAWLGSQPGIDGARVGAWGISLGGGAVWNSTVAGVPWAAVETVETWSDLYRSLAPNDLPKTGLIFAFSQLIPERARTPELTALLQDALAARDLAGIRAFFAPRSSLSGIGQVKTPAYLFQGRQDFAFDIDEATAAFGRLAGPKHLYVGDFGHPPSTFPGPDVSYVLSQGIAWFDRFLKGIPNGIDTKPPVELGDNPWDGRTTSYAGVPRTRGVHVTLGGLSTIGAAGKVVRSARLGAGVETFGAPVVQARLSGTFDHVVAVLEANGNVVSAGGTSVRLAKRPRTVSFRLISDAVRIPAGARLRLTIAASSTKQSSGNLLYLVGVPDRSRLTVGRVVLTLPVAR